MFAPAPAPQAAASAPSRFPFRACIVLTLFYLVLMAGTQPVPIGGDTLPYAADIGSTLGHPWTGSDAIWNFSHVAWRPLGRLVFEIFGPMVSPHYSGDTNTSIIFCLAAINLVMALVAILALHAVLWRLTGREWMPAFLCAAFALLNPMLNYSRFGTPHVAGVAFSILALYFAAFHPRPSWRTATAAGVLSAIAVCLWIQYVMSFPAVLLAGLILARYGSDLKVYLRLCLVTCIAFGTALALVYGIAFIGAHVDSVQTLHAWMREATQDSRDRKALRLVTGMARSVYEMGYDAVWLKWFVFKDPYAQVTLPSLLRASIDKLALFYSALAGLLLVLATSRFGRRLLLLIAVAMGPHIVMALAYESGSVERYLPFLPILWLGIAWVATSPEFSRRTRIVVVLLCCLHIPYNLASSWTAGRHLSASVARLSPLMKLPPKSRIWVIFYTDGIVRLNAGFPFHPINRDPRRPAISLIEQTGDQVPQWRSSFACLSLASMADQGEVWVTRRVLAERPQRDWLWVENDDPRIKWRDLVEFFRPFDHRRISGGDGFFQLSGDPATRARLLGFIPGGDPANCPKYEAGSWRR
jgi:hypothetical protein